MRRLADRPAVGLCAIVLVCATVTGCAERAGGGDRPSGGAAAACEAASIAVEPATAAPGDVVTVTGRGFLDDCADSYGVDEHGATTVAVHPEPYEDLAVELLQGLTTLTSTRASADGFGAFKVELTIPADAAPGTTLTVTAEHAQSATQVAVAAAG